MDKGRLSIPKRDIWDHRSRTRKWWEAFVLHSAEAFQHAKQLQMLSSSFILSEGSSTQGLPRAEARQETGSVTKGRAGFAVPEACASSLAQPYLLPLRMVSGVPTKIPSHSPPPSLGAAGPQEEGRRKWCQPHPSAGFCHPVNAATVAAHQALCHSFTHLPSRTPSQAPAFPTLAS